MYIQDISNKNSRTKINLEYLYRLPRKSIKVYQLGGFVVSISNA